MLQEIKTFRDFLTNDPKKQFAFLPLQIENCMLLKAIEVGEEGTPEAGVSRIVLHIFDSKTNYVGTIENPHSIPDKK